MWWHVVGSAVEHAAKLHATEAADRIAALVDDPSDCPPREISFRKLFLNAEAEEEQTSTLATVLNTMRSRWPNGFKAADVAAFAGMASDDAIEFKAALEQASGKPLPIITPTTINWRLKALTDAPVFLDGTAFVLRYVPDAGKNGGAFAAVRAHSS